MFLPSAAANRWPSFFFFLGSRPCRRASSSRAVLSSPVRPHPFPPPLDEGEVRDLRPPPSLTCPQRSEIQTAPAARWHMYMNTCALLPPPPLHARTETFSATLSNRESPSARCQILAADSYRYKKYDIGDEIIKKLHSVYHYASLNKAFCTHKRFFRSLKSELLGKLLPGWRYSETPFSMFMCGPENQGCLARLLCFSGFRLANVALW